MQAEAFQMRTGSTCAKRDAVGDDRQGKLACHARSQPSSQKGAWRAVHQAATAIERAIANRRSESESSSTSVDTLTTRLPLHNRQWSPRRPEEPI